MENKDDDSTTGKNNSMVVGTILNATGVPSQGEDHGGDDSLDEDKKATRKQGDNEIINNNHNDDDSDYPK